MFLYLQEEFIRTKIIYIMEKATESVTWNCREFLLPWTPVNPRPRVLQGHTILRSLRRPLFYYFVLSKRRLFA
jgi:hypothetical protein